MIAREIVGCCWYLRLIVERSRAARQHFHRLTNQYHHSNFAGLPDVAAAVATAAAATRAGLPLRGPRQRAKQRLAIVTGPGVNILKVGPKLLRYPESLRASLISPILNHTPVGKLKIIIFTYFEDRVRRIFFDADSESPHMT